MQRAAEEARTWADVARETRAIYATVASAARDAASPIPT